MSMYHRTWFPYILIGLTVVLVLVVISFFRSQPEEDVILVSEDAVIAIADIDYESDVSKILLDFYQDENIEKTRNQLLAQRVPSEFLDLHFALILAIDAYQRGETADADARMDEQRALYSWLP